MARSQKTSIVGSRSATQSKVPALTRTTSGNGSIRDNIGDPQEGQKWRSTPLPLSLTS